MNLPLPNLLERIERCLEDRERLTLGEVEILRGLQSRENPKQALSFAQEQELQNIEKKLGLDL